MGRLRSFYGTSVGKKTVMGVTGIVGIAFVVLHAAGNLLAFRGPDALNSYSHFLKSTGELLWIMRLTLVTAVILHVTAAAQLTIRSRAARPLGYSVRESRAATLASRSMRIGGVLLLIFIPLHILHFTTGAIRPAGYFDSANVYGNIVSSFRVWWVTAFYLLTMAFLGLHLLHGAWSSGRSLGIAPPSPAPLKKRIAVVVSVFVWLAFSLVPLGVAGGIIR